MAYEFVILSLFIRFSGRLSESYDSYMGHVIVIIIKQLIVDMENLKGRALRLRRVRDDLFRHDCPSFVNIFVGIFDRKR